MPQKDNRIKIIAAAALVGLAAAFTYLGMDQFAEAVNAFRLALGM